VTEDNRIPEIRAVLDKYERLGAPFATGGLTRIRAILDSAPAAPPQWQVEARIQEQRATSLGYCEHVVEVLSDGEEDTCSELRERGSVFCQRHQPLPDGTAEPSCRPSPPLRPLSTGPLRSAPSPNPPKG
jgi:hypothetical protein